MAVWSRPARVRHGLVYYAALLSSLGQPTVFVRISHIKLVLCVVHYSTTLQDSPDTLRANCPAEQLLRVIPQQHLSCASGDLSGIENADSVTHEIACFACDSTGYAIVYPIIHAARTPFC